MELTSKQQEGLETSLFRYHNNLKYTVISGYAGVGKSTLVRFIIDAIKPNPQQIVYTAYTGKACKVLQQKGNKNVLTLHKLLYKFFMNNKGEYVKTPREYLDYKIIVVDECSMVPQEMIDVLLSYANIYVIFLGDPFQLPPPVGQSNNLLNNPHVFLDEIMRQALDNEIIKLSMDIREGRELPKNFNGKNVKIFSKSELTPNKLLWADQILCATNQTRIQINQEMRTLHGLSGTPKKGDKVICLKNNWNCFDDDGNALVNGTIGIIDTISNAFLPVFSTFKIHNNKIPYYNINLTTEEGTHFCLKADQKIFKDGSPLLSDKEYFKISRIKKFQGALPNNLDYAYAITTWKAQGGEWPKVLLIEEEFPYDKLEHQRFLYTAITRAMDKVVIIRKD